MTRKTKKTQTKVNQQTPTPLPPPTQVMEENRKVFQLTNLINGEKSFHFQRTDLLRFLVRNEHITEFSVRITTVPTNLLY